MTAGPYDATTPPKNSNLDPEVVGKLLVDLESQVSELKNGNTIDMESILAFQRAANYLSAAQIFLRNDGLLTSPLEQDDIKPRLLGHWGTCPGLNLAYAHSNAIITELEAKGENPEWMFVTGPGHGAPAILSSLFLEGSIERFYPEYPMTKKGAEKFIKAFSWPGGFPSHVNAETPGAIHEGGELGYALAVAYGAVMDAPDRIAVVVVGDGESETGPTATAWHGHKYLDPAESGAIIPILHVNGYKIGERTIPGTMDNLELAALYTGYGYQVRIVEYPDYHLEHKTTPERDLAVNYDMAASMRWALDEIHKIQKAARSGKPITKARPPIIILRTPKGWSGPKVLDGHDIEGSWRAHQVPLPQAATDPNQFELLNKWLKSYKAEELFHPDTNDLIDPKVVRIVPKKPHHRMGQVKAAYAAYQPLTSPDWKPFAHEKDSSVSNMKAVGEYILKIVEENPKTFRIFSPDEITSNKLDAALRVTHRDFQWDPETAQNGGRVIEMLSEHTLQGFLQGYALTGRHGLFPSYEAFLGIVTTMVEQYAKFVKMAIETKWRPGVAGLTYIETSTLWRQEHNGYSHQNPGLIGSFISLPRNLARIYFPADANTSVSTVAHCLRSKNFINLVVGSKNPSRVLLTPEEAELHCIAGASTWESYSSDRGVNPDVVLVGCGVEVTFETVAAAAILRNEGVRVRMVNINDLLVLSEYGGPNRHPHALTEESFATLFTTEKPVVVAFHGYPKDMAGLLFTRRTHVGRARFDILGYIEEGTTTTPWSMLRLNDCSRYDIARRAIQHVAATNRNHPVTPRAHLLAANWSHKLREHEKYTLEHGTDPEWCGEIPALKDGHA